MLAVKHIITLRQLQYDERGKESLPCRLLPNFYTRFFLIMVTTCIHKDSLDPRNRYVILYY